MDVKSGISLKFSGNLLRTDVTCLTIINNYIFSGIGAFISIFNKFSYKLVTHIRIFYASKVHGISEGSGRHLIVYGGREIAVIGYDHDNTNLIKIIQLWNVRDWIHCVKWLQNDNIAIVTARNSVILWNWTARETLLTVCCEEKCILYSASFVGSTWDHLVVLAGTVYQEVIIWSPNIVNSGMHCPVLQRLQGHKGVIFSSHYNPETGLIHTTSDDRSIKGWQVNPHNPNNWQFAHISLVYTLYGHNARVWKSIGLKECTISVGEDSQVCIWNTTGKLLKRFSVHQGGSIWSLTCLEQDNLLITGGSDGGITVLSLSNCIKNVDPVFSVPIDQSCFDQENEQTFPRRLVLLSTGHIITILQSGHLMYCSELLNYVQVINKNNTDIIELDQDLGHCYHPGDSHIWTIIHFSIKLGSYCLLEVSPCRQRFALASLDGQILIFEELTEDQTSSKKYYCRKIIDIFAGEGKIFSLQWASTDKILTCETSGKLCLWSLQKEGNTYELIKMKTLNLPFSKERWTTTALLCDNFLICGDRIGSIHLFCIEGDKHETTAPCQTLLKVHGRLGVSNMMIHSNYLQSSGRDGTLRKYQILKAVPFLNIVCTTRMPFDWVSSFCTYADDILVLGFSEKKFVVWSQKLQRLIFEVPCGGGHRSWDYILRGNVIKFGHIKNKCTFLAYFDLQSSLMPFLQTGFHPREVNCLLIINKILDDPFIFSGGEDTTIRISFACSQSQFHTLDVLHSHLSSIRALVSVEIPEEKVLMFSAGGRAQIKAWEVDFELETGASEILPSVLCKELSSHMLMGSNHKQSKSWRLSQPTVDPETRYMSLSVVQHDGAIFVAAGCSDGYLRLLHYHQGEHTFYLVGSYNFHHRCILNVVYVIPMKVVLSMATDGIVGFWNFSALVQNYLSDINDWQGTNHKSSLYEKNECVPMWHCKLHQSGINSYDLKVLESNHCVLATGGDDTALVITVFRFLCNPNSVNSILQWRMESAHVAQITGLAFIGKYLISTSVDQNIFVWEWFCDIEKGLLFVTRIAEYHTSIGDVHGLKVWPSSSEGNSFSLCVYGKGVEIMRNISIEDASK